MLSSPKTELKPATRFQRGCRLHPSRKKLQVCVTVPTLMAHALISGTAIAESAENSATAPSDAANIQFGRSYHSPL
jgi:hypothetical protein